MSIWRQAICLDCQTMRQLPPKIKVCGYCKERRENRKTGYAPRVNRNYRRWAS